jgi:hypothetical protein
MGGYKRGRDAGGKVSVIAAAGSGIDMLSVPLSVQDAFNSLRSEVHQAKRALAAKVGIVSSARQCDVGVLTVAAGTVSRFRTINTVCQARTPTTPTLRAVCLVATN